MQKSFLTIDIFILLLLAQTTFNNSDEKKNTRTYTEL